MRSGIGQDVNYEEERIIGEVKEAEDSEDEEKGSSYNQACISCKLRVSPS